MNSCWYPMAEIYPFPNFFANYFEFDNLILPNIPAIQYMIKHYLRPQLSVWIMLVSLLSCCDMQME